MNLGASLLLQETALSTTSLQAFNIFELARPSKIFDFFYFSMFFQGSQVLNFVSIPSRIDETQAYEIMLLTGKD